MRSIRAEPCQGAPTDLLKSVSRVGVKRMRDAPSRERYDTASTPVKDNFLSY